MHQCISFNTTGDIEPRFWREDAKKILHDDSVDQLRTLHFIIKMFFLESASGEAEPVEIQDLPSRSECPHHECELCSW